ncbi:MAG: hypothetical protein Fur0043_24230 [Anaerolineales bacterium]
MLKIKDVLTNKIALVIECVDRVYLNGYVKNLQMAFAAADCQIRC